MVTEPKLLSDDELRVIRERAEGHYPVLRELQEAVVRSAAEVPSLLSHIAAQAAEIERLRKALEA